MIGKKVWAIAEGYIPSDTTIEQDRAFISHETVCLLNAGESGAEVEIIIYFADRDPVGPYNVHVPARRTRHVRFNDLAEPAPIPRDTDYSCVVRSSEPIVVQHTRLDTRRGNLALLSTLAYAE